MKRIKICALALGTCMILGSFAGCSKTEETEATTEKAVETTAETTAETTDVIIVPDETSAETSAEASEETTAEAAAETTAETTAETAAETTAEPAETEAEYLELNAENQRYANTFVSNFAEQSLNSIDREAYTFEQYMDFVHIHLKINAQDAISRETKGDLTFETFTFEKAQSVISKYFGKLIRTGYEELPVPPETFGDQPAGPYYEDGKIWYEAADGEAHTQIAIVDEIENNFDGTLTLRFTVYAIDAETYLGLDANGISAYYGKTPDEAKADSTLNVVTTGTARVDVAQSGDFLLMTYKTELGY